GNDLVLRGGAGGVSDTSGGKAGAGGSVIDFDVRNPGVSAEAQQSRMFVDAGDGGLTTGVSSAGGNGGLTQKGVLVGFSIGVTGGNGSQGTKGGVGGSVRSIVAQDGFFGVRPNNVAIDAGSGGIGSAGKGGKGGLIDGITVQNAELSQFDINQTVGAGDGADSQRGPGGPGGNVSNLTVNDLDTQTSSEVTMRISAGDGGKGGVAPGGHGGQGGGARGETASRAVRSAARTCSKGSMFRLPSTVVLVVRLPAPARAEPAVQLRTFPSVPSVSSEARPPRQLSTLEPVALECRPAKEVS